jgi:hypothetical protein
VTDLTELIFLKQFHDKEHFNKFMFIKVILLLVCFAVVTEAASRRRAIFLSKPSASTSVMPTALQFFGTNTSGANNQFTNTIDAAATYIQVAAVEFGAANAFTSVTITNVGSGVGVACALLTRTNATTGGGSADYLSIWHVLNPPTGSCEIRYTAAGNPFPTIGVVSYKDNNGSDPVNSNITLGFSSVAIPGQTNNVTSATGQLVFGFAAAAAYITVTGTTTGIGKVGQYIGTGGDYDIVCFTNAGAATGTIGFTSANTAQGSVTGSVKP